MSFDIETWFSTLRDRALQLEVEKRERHRSLANLKYDVDSQLRVGLRVLQETIAQFTTSLDAILEAVLDAVNAEEHKLLKEIDLIHAGLVASEMKQCSEVLGVLQLGDKLFPSSPKERLSASMPVRNLDASMAGQTDSPFKGRQSHMESQVTVAGVESLRALVAAVRSDGSSIEDMFPSSQQTSLEQAVVGTKRRAEELIHVVGDRVASLECAFAQLFRRQPLNGMPGKNRKAKSASPTRPRRERSFDDRGNIHSTPTCAHAFQATHGSECIPPLPGAHVAPVQQHLVVRSWVSVSPERKYRTMVRPPIPCTSPTVPTTMMQPSEAGGVGRGLSRSLTPQTRARMCKLAQEPRIASTGAVEKPVLPDHDDRFIRAVSSVVQSQACRDSRGGGSRSTSQDICLRETTALSSSPSRMGTEHFGELRRGPPDPPAVLCRGVIPVAALSALDSNRIFKSPDD